MQEIESEVDEPNLAGAVARGLGLRKLGKPSSPMPHNSSSRYAFFASTFTNASTTLGYLSLQSSPVHVSNCTRPRSIRADMRKPWSLISCSHRGPEGAASTSWQSWGGIQRGRGDADGEPDLATFEIGWPSIGDRDEAQIVTQSSTKVFATANGGNRSRAISPS
jgi:hypothetical protein